MKLVNIYNVIFLILSLFLAGCKKFVDVNSPVTQVDASVVYSKDATAISVLTGLYQNLNANSGFATGVSSISLIGGLSSDELITYSGNGDLLVAAYKNALSGADYPGVPFWANIYSNIYVVNTALQGLTASATLTPGVKQQLIGEASFLRAFFYFYLVNFFGDIPLLTSNNFSANSIASRASKSEVYKQVISDLKVAQALLSSNFVASDALTLTSERIRPTKWAATALLARTYLYLRDYDSSEVQATSVINNSTQFSLVNLDSTFLKNSTEAIWQLQPTTFGYNTMDGFTFILSASPSTIHPVAISNQLLSAFEPNDKRATHWINSLVVGSNKYYYPYKYKNGVYNASNLPATEYLGMLRIAEQYLIRAEARAQEGNTVGAQGAIADLNLIRTRAGLLNYLGPTDKQSVLQQISHERQVELFTEWGHRWLDLIRTQAVTSVMTVVGPLKGGVWDPNWALYPIPQGEIKFDPSLKQNPGYQ